MLETSTDKTSRNRSYQNISFTKPFSLVFRISPPQYQQPHYTSTTLFSPHHRGNADNNSSFFPTMPAAVNGSKQLQKLPQLETTDDDLDLSSIKSQL